MRRCLARRKIVIPPIPDASGAEAPAAVPVEALSRYLGGADAEHLQRAERLHAFAAAADHDRSTIWEQSKAHLRRQDRLVGELGVDGAVSELLKPQRQSFAQRLRERPVDRNIVEEIHRGLHGRRAERYLRRGMKWEHWVAKDPQNAPVRGASRGAQECFAFGGSVERVAHCTDMTRFPAGGRPEVAFVGRTNGGKSSLINAILNHVACPFGHLRGTTNHADFYAIGSKLMMVDLPGYGFTHPLATSASAAESAKRVLGQYLACVEGGDGRSRRPSRNIKRVFVCVSSTGMQSADERICDRLDKAGVPFAVLLTKTDVVSIRFLARMVDYTRSLLVKYANCHELMMVSALRLSGVRKVQNLVGRLARPEETVIEGSFEDIV